MGCFARNASGSTAIEYALIAGLIFLVIVTAVGNMGSNLLGLYQRIHF